jgi:hypothetical protein
MRTTRMTLWPRRSGYTSAKPILDVGDRAAGCTCTTQPPGARQPPDSRRYVDSSRQGATCVPAGHD